MNMSTISRFLILFLCISWNDNPCSARILGEEKKFHLSSKNNGDEKVINPDKISVTANDQKASFSNKLEAAMVDGNKIEESAIHEATQKIKDTAQISDHAVQKGSVGSFSWSVPRTKNSDKHPGFNFDYSPPKTHPPSHN